MGPSPPGALAGLSSFPVSPGAIDLVGLLEAGEDGLRRVGWPSRCFLGVPTLESPHVYRQMSGLSLPHLGVCGDST